MSRHPQVKWAERADKVFLTVLLPDSKNTKVNVDPEGVFTFSANAGAENHLYELKLELHDKVNVEASKINIGVRNIFCILEKAEQGWWKRLLRGGGKPPHYIKVDWDKWVDEDEDKGGGLGDLDLGGMDFSSFGDGGLGGMGGMGGMDEFEDSDDEEETAKPGDDKNDAKEEEGKAEETAAAATAGEAKHEEQTTAVKSDN